MHDIIKELEKLSSNQEFFEDNQGKLSCQDQKLNIIYFFNCFTTILGAIM